MKREDPKISLKNLRLQMDAIGMIPADLARATGWSEAKVSRLLNNVTGDVTVTMLRELNQATGAAVAALLDLEDVAQNEKERALLRDFREAAERDREIAQAALAPRRG